MAAAEGTSSDTITNGCPIEFEDWLSSRMRQLGLDEDVFGSYVTGVLDSEDTDEERKDALIGILEGMTEYPLDDLCNEVIDRWKSSRAEVLHKKQQVKEQQAAEKQHKLAEIMEKQASTVSAMKPVQANSDGNLKKLLLAQYGHESDEDLCDNSDEEQATDKESGMLKNMNTQAITDREKDKRDKMKEENEQKKQQIKEAKEKQKQKAEDRKEKEKKRTQKGERRTR